MPLIRPFPVLATNFKIVNISNSFTDTFERQGFTILTDLIPKR